MLSVCGVSKSGDAWCRRGATFSSPPASGTSPSDAPPRERARSRDEARDDERVGGRSMSNASVHSTDGVGGVTLAVPGAFTAPICGVTLDGRTGTTAGAEPLPLAGAVA